MFEVIKRLLAILTRRQKKVVGIIIAMMVVSGIFETLGVSIVIPIISVVTNPEGIMENEWVSLICTVLNISSAKEMIVVLMCGMMAIFVLKNIYLLLVSYVQIRFVYNSQYQLRMEVLQKLLARPYEYFLDIDTSVTIRLMETDIKNVFVMLSTVMSMVSEIIIAIFLVVAIFVVNPFVTCTVFVILAGTVIVSTKFFRPRIHKLGQDALNENSSMHKWLIQALQGIKDVKIGQNEGFFCNKYSESSSKYTKSEKTNTFISYIPRTLTETFFMVGMLSVILVLIMQGVEMTKLLPQLSAFAVAAIRLLPASNRLIGYRNGLSYCQPSLDSVLEFLKTIDKQYEEKPMHDKKNSLLFSSVIEIKDVEYRYPGVNKSVFRDANMKIHFGRAIGIIGTSGAGKTTIVDVLIGLLCPCAGQVLVDGIDIRQNYYGWLDMIGYIPQTIYLIDDTIMANVGLGVQDEDISEEMIWKALEEAQMAEYVQSLPEGIHTRIGERGIRLSGGQRQRLGIARALYKDPGVLIFDEATSALDNETEKAIMESINKLHGRKTMIIIAHRLTTIEDCDEVYRVQNGRIERVR